MKRTQPITLVALALTALLAAAPAAPALAQSAPPGAMTQSKNSLVTKFTRQGFSFGKSQALGNGFLYHGTNRAAQASADILTVKTGVASVAVTYPGLAGAAADAAENHQIELQKALKALLPNWADGASWLQTAFAVTVNDANAGLASSQKASPESIETADVYITVENVLDGGSVAYRLTVSNVAQLATLEIESASAAPVAPAPVAPAPLVAQPAPVAEQPAPTDVPAAPPAQPANNCDPAYPTLCIPVGSPDLDCPDIGVKDFPVKPPDPHRFDRDHDGIGCES